MEWVMIDVIIPVVCEAIAVTGFVVIATVLVWILAQ
jgi:hypothetical protein